MSEPLVSVVIPCYEQSSFLGEAIGSVEAQTRDDWEIVVVDDGSSYEERRAIERIAGGHRLVRQKNKGLAGARNAGIRSAEGRYIVCLDADDRLLPAYLERTLPSAGSANVVCPGLRMFGERTDVCMPQEPFEAFPPFGVPRILLGNPVFQSSLFPRALWERVGGYDELMRDGYEDWEFWVRLAKARARFVLVHEPLYEYRVRSGSMITSAEQKHGRIVAYMRSKHPEMLGR